jgi:phosphoribosylformylglycinamidine synthase
MLTILGSAALSAFRARRLSARLREDIAGLDQVQAHYVHFIDTETSLSDDEMRVLEQLLH